ncbi:hypothetical protein MMC27_000231 [Xylographa pallens]|nr:hypothetical protein [Xylographa pallens]
MILSSLFDVAGVSLDNTPGLGEFDKIREALLPLVRRTEFKEKVGHYHYRFHSLLDAKGLTKINPYEAMPHEKDIPTIICMLSNLTQNSNQILNYRGITGAGWVAAYASYILGIKTCVIDSFGKTLPINGALEDSKVVIWISFSKPDTQCELSIAGKIEQFIVLQSASELERTGWSIDCTKLCFLDENVPGLKEAPEFLCISEFTAVEAMNELFDLIGDSAEVDLRTYLQLGRRPYPYYMVAFRALYIRILDILRIFGFSCPPITSFFIESGQDELFEAPRLVNEAEKGAFFLDYLLKQPRKSNETSKLQKLPSYINMKCGRAGLQHVPSLTGWSDAAQKNISEIVEYAAHIAAHLSFTDWPTSVKLLTVGHFYQKKSLTLKSITVKNILHHLIPICIDSFSAQHLKESYGEVEWAGLDIDGVVVLRSAALLDSSIDVKGQLLTLYSGRMMHEGTRISTVKISLDGGQALICTTHDEEKAMMEKAFTESFTWELINPDRFETVESYEIHQTITRRMDVLMLQHAYLCPGAIRIPRTPGGFSLFVPDVYVTRSCNHHLETPVRLHMHQLQSERTYLLLGINPSRINRLYHINLKAPRKSERKDEWAPALFLDPKALSLDKTTIILQAQTCLHCVLHQITMLMEKTINHRKFHIARIPQSASMPHSVPAPSGRSIFEACQDFNAIKYEISSPEKYRNLSCPASVHVPCCAGELPKPISYGKTSHVPCNACVPQICPRESNPCQGCQKLYESVPADRVSDDITMQDDLQPSENSGSLGGDTAINSRISGGGGEERKASSSR